VSRLDRESVLEAAQRLAPDVVLLDLQIDDQGGTSVPWIEPLRETGACVVMVTGITDRVKLAECIEAGALGVVSKGESFDHLLETIKEAAEMQSLISKSQRDDLLAELRRQRSEDEQRLAPFQRLTAREQQVLAALMDGKSAEHIAEDWVVSLATVRSQIRSVLMKLGVNSQLSAVAMARRSGWVPTD
jgi:DNA-binding NarL/FixJ family response regulator